MNKQIINLLSTLGIPDSYIEGMLNNYLTLLADSDRFIDFISNRDIKDLIVLMSNNGFKPENDIFLLTIMKANYQLMCSELKKKNRIYVKYSTLMKGIVDEYGLLKENEVYATISTSNKYNDPENFTLVGNMVVTRCPCLMPGDIRKINFVDFSFEGKVINNYKETEEGQKIKNDLFCNKTTEDRQLYTKELSTKKDAIKAKFLKELVNVIVFPSIGNESLPSSMSGGDLDGDDYFIFWDEGLVNVQPVKPFKYIEPKLVVEDNRPNSNNEITITDIINHFVNYEGGDTLGKLTLL